MFGQHYNGLGKEASLEQNLGLFFLDYSHAPEETTD